MANTWWRYSVELDWDKELMLDMFRQERERMDAEEVRYFGAMPADLEALPALEASVRTYLRGLQPERRQVACTRIRGFLPAMRQPAINTHILPPHLAHLAGARNAAPIVTDDIAQIARAEWLNRLDSIASAEQRGGES